MVIKFTKLKIWHLQELIVLTQLYLRNNRIEKMGNDLLGSQKHLRYLDVSNNPLTNLSLNGLFSLEILNMSETMIQTLDYNLKFLTMKVISLKASQLSEVDFSLLPRSNEIDLSNNKIEILENCESLDTRRINLSRNRISKIDGPFGQISDFTISYNQLQTLENNLFNASKLTFFIDCSFNNISTIEEKVFLGLNFLEQLLLQNNNINKIKPALFKDLSNLKVLNLSNNNISDFYYGTFDTLSNLEMLDISGNKLVDLHQYTFTSLSKLNVLHFSRNFISSLQVDDLTSHLKNLRIISLDNNPWKCKDLVEFNHILKLMKVSISKGINYDTDNFQGIACQNNKSAINVVKDYQTSIDNSIKDSRMEKFFNEDFHHSKFFQYFEKDYMRSNFFKNVYNYQLPTVNFDNFSDSNFEKLSYQEGPFFEKDNKFLIFSAVTQVIIIFILVLGFYFMANFLKKIMKMETSSERISQMELC